MMRTVLIHKENNICTLTINRPKQYNALNRSVLEELNEAIKKIKNDRNCRAIIITGAGDKAFIAGDMSGLSNETFYEGKKNNE